MGSEITWKTASIKYTGDNAFVRFSVKAGHYYTIEVSPHSGHWGINARLLEERGSGFLAWFKEEGDSGSVFLSFGATSDRHVFVAPGFGSFGVGGFDVSLYEGRDLFPTNGDDRLSGSGARNRIDLRNGDDEYHAAGGSDVVDGGAGNDRLFGGSQRDFLSGGAGDDTLKGQTGEDYLRGDDGNDRIRGGRGADTLLGEDGHDSLWGGNGRDSLEGGSGRDALFGGKDGDRLEGGAGRDVLTGGSGADVFIFKSGDGRDTILDFGRGNDRLRLDEDIWGGGLTIEQLLDRHACAADGSTLLEFEDQLIRLKGVTDPETLLDDVTLF